MGDKIRVEERIIFTETHLRLLKSRYAKLSIPINEAIRFVLNNLDDFAEYFHKNALKYLTREDIVEKREKVWFEKELFDKLGEIVKKLRMKSPLASKKAVLSLAIVYYLERQETIEVEQKPKKSPQIVI